MKKTKILLADIETSFIKVEMPVFGLFYPNKMISHKHIKKDWYIISIAWRFEGNKKIHSVSVLDDPKRFKKDPCDDTHVIKTFSKVLESADLVVGHNFKQFDARKINARLITNGLPPIADYTIYDTLRISKRIANFTSHRLDFLAQRLGYKGKTSSEGLHQKIYDANGNAPEAIKSMVKYNKNDVDILEYVFNWLKPYGPDIPHLASRNNKSKKTPNVNTCTKCGSKNLSKNGSKFKASGKIQIYRCGDCGGITQGEKL